MSSLVDGFATLGGELAALTPIIEPGRNSRFPVIRTKRTATREPIDSTDRQFVYARDGFNCVRCASENRLTLDHIVPWSAGGSDHVDNLRTLCWSCNEERSNFRGVDDTWTPLPLTFCCVDCESELQAKYSDIPSATLIHPGAIACFCWWHRQPAIGIRSLWFDENNAFWDYDLNWHRPIYPGYSRSAWDEACDRLKFPILFEGKPAPIESVLRALHQIEISQEWAEALRQSGGEAAAHG